MMLIRRVTLLALALSSVLPFAAVAQSRTTEVDAGPIWSNADAQKKCPDIAKANNGTWDGKWRTTVPGRMSVCEIRLSSRGRYTVKTIDAGPIWNQSDAEKKCPEVAKNNNGTWDGQWHTTVPGRMSVCEIRIPRPKN